MVATRHVLTSSACGICGTESLQQLHTAGPPTDSDRPYRSAPIISVQGPDRLREAQRAFAQTGGLHAAGLMDSPPATMLCVRGDVGRHNAVDKVIGGPSRPACLLTDVVWSRPAVPPTS